ncbi:MAG: TadE/TadG family type IV pilus assembly protein [Rickettsiales bacterium]
MKHRVKTSRLLSLLWREEGTTAIEMAIVLPLVMTLIMGIIEFGIMFHLSSLMTYAGNEAARLGKTGDTYGYSNAECVANNNCREQLTLKTVHDRMKDWVHDDGSLVVTQKSFGSFADLGASGTSGAGSGGQIVVYTVTLNWKLLTPLVGQIIGGEDGTIPITTQVLVKNESF